MMTLSMIWVLGQAAQQGGATPGTGGWLVWGIVLLAVAVAVFFVEVFVPSGGVMGCVSGACAVAGVFCLFRVDTTLGLVAAAVSLVSMPFLAAFALKIWPDTPFGRWITLDDAPPVEDTKPAPTATADGLGAHASPVQPLSVGDRGESITVLRPVGACRINGKRVECLAKGGRIEPGHRVRVVAIDGGEVWVQSDDG